MGHAVVGIDIGGTFTDVVVEDLETGHVKAIKVRSSPPDYAAGFFAGLARAGREFDEIDRIVHGTTAPLNALLERRGTHTGLVATRGFGDVYRMARGNRIRMYDLHYRHPEPLVPRYLVFEVDERIDPRGNVVLPVSQQSIDLLVEAIRSSGVKSVAICLLHSYALPDHEQRVAEHLRRGLPGVSVYTSVDLCPEWREYERTSTTVINAYVSPILAGYLRGLEADLLRRGYRRPLLLMQSNGGLIEASLAVDRAVLTLMSGPVGGAVGCQTLSSMPGEGNLICIDMGGTSFDFSLIINGESAASGQRELAGFPILAPSVDIQTIGAGGGSIAWVEAGALRVGPRSAGARPGPACYGSGGTEPTVTDADLVLGRIDPTAFLGGEMLLDEGAAHSAIESLAASLGLTVQRMAEGIVGVVDGKMANAIRSITIGRGLDPRNFVIVAFGGAGPLHAAAIAEELGIRRVVVPASAGVFSAWGMLQADLRHEAVQTVMWRVDEEVDRNVDAAFDALRERLQGLLAAEGVDDEERTYIRSFDMRYLGQEYYISVPIDDPQGRGAYRGWEDVRRRFGRLYEERYGHQNENEEAEIVNIRMEGVGRLRRSGSPVLPTGGPRQRLPRPGMGGVSTAPDRGRHVSRDTIDTEERLNGPVVISEMSCTTYVPPGWIARVDADRHLWLERTTGEDE